MPPTDPREATRLILAEHITTLTALPRVPGSPGHRAAGTYIRDWLRREGFVVNECRFRGPGFDGVNLLTRPLPDRPDLPLLIIGAHYDSAPGTPGADDNASGVAALLDLANEISLRRARAESWTCRLQLAAYDLEEYGMIGSWTHSRELRQAGASVRGMIALEMLGYADTRLGSQRLPPHLAGLYPDVGDFIGVCGNEASRSLLQAFEAGMKAVPRLKVESLAVRGNGEELMEVRLSDHSSFWDEGFPALMITDTSFFRNPHYHQATDTLETLDLAFLERVSTGVQAAVVGLLEG